MIDYIRRAWVDGEVITADKLNNIEAGVSESLKNSEESLINAKKALNLATQISHIAEGSYSGTGSTYTRNSLTFDFVPKFIYIATYAHDVTDNIVHEIGFASMVIIPTAQRGGSVSYWYDQDGNAESWGLNIVETIGNTVYWKRGTAAFNGQRGQMNEAGRIYRYIAIG